MTWEQDTVNRVGQQIQKARKDRGMSAQALSDRTAELGYPIGRATISEYENHRRKSMTLCELFVLAAALDTSPAALLFAGQLKDGPVEVLPGRSVTAGQALLWHNGIDLSAAVDSGDVPTSNYAIQLVHDLDSNDKMSRTGRISERMLDHFLGERLHILERMQEIGLIVDDEMRTATIDPMARRQLTRGKDGDDQQV